MQDFRTLKAWPQAHTLAVDVVRASVRWSIGDLSDVVRQSALLLPAALAQSCLDAPGALAAAVERTRAHLADLRTFLLLARDLDELAACDFAAFDLRIARLHRQLDALQRTARAAHAAETLN